MTDHLKSLAQRIENLMDERDGIQSDIRDIYAEAKSHGYVPKVLRKAITRKRMDAGKRDEEDAILELYEDALGPVGKAVAAVRAGATWKDAAEEHSVPRATLARAVKVSKQQTDTAEITPPSSGGEGEELGVPLGRVSASDEHSTPRSLAADASDSMEPVEPARKDGSAGERGPTSATGNSAHEGEENAAQEGRVDGASVLPRAEAVVPPCTTPQTDDVATLSVTPVPDEGVGAGAKLDDLTLLSRLAAKRKEIESRRAGT